ncbi:MAG: protein-glutamate O-methyltransferase CheR [Opitutus sp.]
MSSPRPPGALPTPKAHDPVPTLLRDLIHERTGIHFDSDRLDTMMEKLEPRAAARNCESYLDYYYILKYDKHAIDEWRRVMDAFSVQETYFWREVDQIHALTGQVVPAHFLASPLPLRIWSAACATGEEPYSIVMALREAGWGHHPIEVYASDASDAALAKARACVYRERSFRTLPPALREKYFEHRGETYHLNNDIASKVTFHWDNLVNLQNSTRVMHADVIFCRNVFIYFSASTIQRVVGSFARRMSAGSHLFVGASESLLKLTEDFDLLEMKGTFAYVRNHHPAKHV